jgi:uroporphyrinogen-III synthase
MLLTRPAAQGDRFAADLLARFGTAVEPVTSPLMVPELLAPDWPEDTYSCLILTSEAGVEGAVRLREAGRTLPVRAICVGDRTAAVARGSGFDAQSAQGDAEALIALILAGDEVGPFLHLRGKDARGDIAPRLSAKGRPTVAAVVYDQRAVPLTDAARRLLAGDRAVVVPLFSPRSVDLLVAQGPFTAPLRVAALSPAVAARAVGLGPERMVVAERPDAAAMMDAVASLIPDPHA